MNNIEEIGTTPKVNIILAVYNGEKYLQKQLDSLLAQTYENITIYIRDDGSTDGTVAFLRKYMEAHGGEKKIILLEPDGRNLKCPGSFYEILRKCEKADYYSLCDQDDYWYPDKVAWAVERLEQEKNKKEKQDIKADRPKKAGPDEQENGAEQEEVLVYYSASDYLAADDSFIRKSPLQKEKLLLEDTLYYTPGSGFTLVFNEKARQQLIFEHTPGRELHDRWLLRGAACFGKALYDPRSTAAHIRHEDAVTAGDADNRNLILNFIQNELCGGGAGKEKEALKYFYHTFRSELSQKECKTLELFAGDRNTPVTWLKKVFFPKRLRRRLPGEIALRILFFLGRI